MCMSDGKGAVTVDTYIYVCVYKTEHRALWYDMTTGTCASDEGMDG